MLFFLIKFVKIKIKGIDSKSVQNFTQKYKKLFLNLVRFRGMTICHLHVSVIDLQNGIAYNDKNYRGFMRPEANVKEFYVAYAKQLYKNPFNYNETWKCEEKDI